MTQEEAINRLKEEIDEYTPFADKWNEAKLDIKALKMAIQALEQTQWIPVTEKLPEERKSVLVYAPEYNNIYCAYLSGNTWFIFGGYGSYAVANVVAWMPLPEPYKAESE